LLTKQEVRDIRKRSRRARKDLRVEQLRDPLATVTKMLAPHEGSLTEELLHRQRILTKRARYVAEFALPSPEAERLIVKLKKAQDALGDWHDWLTLTHTAAQRLGDIHQSSLVAVLHNLTGAKYRKAVSALPIASAPKRITRSTTAEKSSAVTPSLSREATPAA
jgi:CHAD domain-containing protein